MDQVTVEGSMIIPVETPRDLEQFEEQARCDRHYRALYPILQDSWNATGAGVLGPLARGAEYVTQWGDAGRTILQDLANEIQHHQRNVTVEGRDQTAARRAGLTYLDEVREKGDRILAVHTNVALAGRAITDLALLSAWEVFSHIVPPAERLQRTVMWLHEYHQERREAWLTRLRQIVRPVLDVPVDDLDVSWVSPSFQRSEWVLANLPQHWDATVPRHGG